MNTMHAIRSVRQGLSLSGMRMPAHMSVYYSSCAPAHTGRVGTHSVIARAAEAETDAPAEPVAEPLPTYAVDLRVGRILSCETHPDADSLYVEKIDVGEEEPRTIISGLVNFVPLEEMVDRNVVVICNLKARNMRGIKSHGMVLCSSDESHENVEPLTPPEGAQIGERIWFEENQPEAEKENKVQKKKLWEAVQPDLKTTEDLVATYKGIPMMTSAGPVKTATLANANIS